VRPVADPSFLRRPLRFLLGAALAVAALAACSPPEGPAPGLLFLDARVVDGTGAPARTADIRVVGDTIAVVGELEPAEGDEVIRAEGRVLAPGFIDTHSHHDIGIFEYRDVRAAVNQGVTTVVVGQDGGSHRPLAGFFASLRETPPAVNVASFAGHGTIRRQAMGGDYRREATPEEIEEMARLLREDLAAGALGLSTGLEYDPGIYASTDELVALARVAAEAGGRYATHMRSEDRAIWSAVDEVLEIGRRAEIPVHISHMKLAIRRDWGEAERLLDRLDAARDAGLRVSADVYPYTYWQSTMTVLLPDRDYGDRKAAAFALEQLARPERMTLATFRPEPSYQGRTLAHVARERGEDPVTTYLALIRMAREYRAEHGSEERVESVVARSMHPDDVAELLAWEHASVCSDGGVAGAHPRGYAAFTRVLARHVRETGRLKLEEAVHKMTGLAADNVGLEGRGVLRPGAPADLVLFDPEAVEDRATFAGPHRTAEGIHGVWVNGTRVYGPDGTTDARPGRPLVRP
jgi:N-acyl-D-amino-acid deacylase